MFKKTVFQNLIMRTISILGIFIYSLFISCGKQLHNSNIINNKELVELLEIKKWELPMPKDTLLAWAFNSRDFKEYTVIEKGKDEWMDKKRKAKIVFMPTGNNSVHRFWFTQNNGTSSGSCRIDVCDKPEDVETKCDFGQIETEWFNPPIRIDDGKVYLICEVEETFNSSRKKQLILYLVKYKLKNDELYDKKP